MATIDHKMSTDPENIFELFEMLFRPLSSTYHYLLTHWPFYFLNNVLKTYKNLLFGNQQVKVVN